MTTPSHSRFFNPPAHVAIIMDGNGRWARARGRDRSEGHAEGVNTVRRITEAASRAGIKYLTLYTFSTENWNRPQGEVDALMHLIVMAIERETPDLIKNNVALKVIGNRKRIPREVDLRLAACEEATSSSTGLTLILAISYSSRWEITEAARQLAREAAEGKISPDDITPDDISSHLTTAPFPDPDLIIRTGGDMRLSNFLLWQAAYAEIFVTPTYWPDFTEDDFIEAIRQFAARERRYGLTSDQIKSHID
ncbi:MAG: isoprenyl transferase [Pseudoflavonifractor sp.]|nr:isoprenyl transferase [Alloprevotella sp.]MCM1116464.1 isoprenyl transferase [Pseudoflavonifractor sp.]